MANNTIPESFAGITMLGGQMHAGLVALGTQLGITQITAAGFGTALDDYMMAEAGYNSGRSAQRTKSDDWKGAMATLYAWLLDVRLVLVSEFGARYSTLWTQAGFINNTTAVPYRLDARLTLAFSLEAFFAENPQYANAPMNVTGARAAELRGAALSAQTALASATAAATGLEQARDAKRATLLGLMRGLVKILTATLSRTDARWTSFGLEIPALDTTPAAPLGLAAVLLPSGAIQLTCDATALARRYRFRMRVPAAETAYALVGSSTAPLVQVPGVLPGQTVEFIAQAVNGSAQSVASEPLLFTVPPLAAAAAEPAADGEPAPRAVKPGPRHLPLPARAAVSQSQPARSR